MNQSSPALIDIKNIKKSFKKPDKQELLVIDNVSLTMHEGDIVALLGKSGSGKSTLLRIIAGLIPPSSGEVLYRGKAVKSPIPGISMVFQNFALMPWLTVLQNVELGLEAQGISYKERRERALRAIDMIGMDGFESAYPKELSGGMRQRVGFARALVVKPDLLLMDEPFSALDVLTAENLRNDLLELWHDKETNLKGILFVTHNIEEAVLVADRIVVFGSNPGFIRGELKIDLPHPRNSQDPAVLNLIDDVYTVMTSAEHENIKALAAKRKLVGLDYRLPEVGVAELIGLLEEVDELQQKGPVDLPDLADVVRLDIDTLFPVLEALSVLNLAKVSEGDIAMTSKGKELLGADITEKKIIFAKLLLQHIPLAQHVLEVLQSRPHHRISETYFKNELEDYFTEDEAERVLTTLINWARYAEIFAYDYNTGMLSLEDVK
ncbi:MAG: cmpD [Gammaproteobacteria bacterium]|jgi:NitT/TauT family transport system ATP-binding protein|nr:cmpD [Gammaproteobacteria bacterium]